MAVDVLPQPLTLDYALSLLDEEHPSLQQAQADQLRAQATQREADAGDDVTVSLEARARWVQPPSTSEDGILDDHKGSLFVRKSLYDFGRTEGLQQAARGDAEAAVERYQSSRDVRRLAIMRGYFDVLRADQENFRDNEAMAVAFISLDRLRNRQELGEASDIEVLEQESSYQSVRQQVLTSQSRQRLTRSQLANLLNRPGDLPSDLVTPSFTRTDLPLPDYDQMLSMAEENNLTLKALRLQLQAAQQRVGAAQANKHPTLNGEIEASEYSRELGSSDSFRVGVTLSVPIYNGDRVDAAVAKAQSEVLRINAKLHEAEQEIRQALLTSWFELQRLALAREKALAELDFRELYLDRSRANYEMEVKADLGDAMIRLSDAQLALINNDFDTELAWETLRALTGVEMSRLEALATKGQGE